MTHFKSKGMACSPRTKAIAAIAMVLIIFFGLWKLENSSRYETSLVELRGVKSATAAKQLAAKKRRIYEGNPAMDFELQDIRVFGGRDNPAHAIAYTYGYRNIIGPAKK